jgi:hypothetical protein
MTPELSDDDIYADVGDDYDPLADLGESDDSDEAEKKTPANTGETEKTESLPASRFPRNYFDDDSSTLSVLKSGPDPTFMAAIAAANKRAAESGATPDEERLKKRAALLAQDRDLDDIDMGFGSSRFDDGEEEQEPGHGGHKKKRARKRKGDKNSVTDVMRVIEGRK